MRKQGLPLQRLLGGDALITHRPRPAATPTSPRCTRRSGRARSPRSRWCRSWSPALGGAEGAVEDIAETAVPTRPAARRGTGAATPASWSRASRDVWVKLATCCTPVPGDDDPRLRHPRRRGQRAPRRLHQRRRPAAQSRSGWSRWSGSRRAGSVFLVAIQVEALDRHRLLVRRHPGAVRRAGEHPVRDGHHHPRPGGGQPLHLRDGRPEAPRATCCGPSATSTACTTCTASRRGRSRPPPSSPSITERARQVGLPMTCSHAE